MSSPCPPDSDISAWLATIHLERYRDVFKQHGYHVAGDATTLDGDNLHQMGITATGHRKRILNLVQQTRLLSPAREKPPAGDPQLPATEVPGGPQAGEDARRAEPRGGSESLGTQQRVPLPTQPSPLEKDPAPPLLKPVPKPRTVFPRSKAQQGSGHPPQGTRSEVPGPPGAFVVLEGFVPGESSTDLESPEPGGAVAMGMGASRLRAREEPRLPPAPDHGQTWEAREKSPPAVPSVPPRHSHRTPATQPNLGTLAEGHPAASTPLPTTARTDPSPGPRATRQPSPGQGRLEMVSNVIYEGLRCPAAPTEDSGGVDGPQGQPPALSPQEVAQVDNVTDRLSWHGGNLPPIPQRPTSKPEVGEQPVSPYCETLFGHGAPTRDQKGVCSSSEQNYEAVSELDLEPEAFRRSSGGSSEGRSEDEESRSRIIDRIVQNDTHGYSTVDAPRAEDIPFSLPAHLYPDEVQEDLTISPYASFMSLSEPRPTMLSGWLDKLSPQGNYVFQRRYVRFDGKNLMYFSSEKEPYPKGVIPLSVIQMARSTKDNKFQVFTSHRIFVFRAENEAQRNEWCSTLQKKVTEQRLVGSQPRPANTAHCQKSGTLEMKGQKSKVFAALSLPELWLYKSEQFFKTGIGICLIELRGSTIREAKNRGFELITPFKTFSFVAESEREKREWMQALQEAIAEMLYDYEVAEKIWSNKANKYCADCWAPSPDWASINLCVVICKQCAGQHRSLGSNISKVQSLKLDTSVWSNEIVQLFIVLGNNRANRFWAGHLPATEVLHPEASAEQRRDFISRKYREGRYRLPHPHYSTQEEVLQALCAAVTGPALLKTVLQFFSSSEAGLAGDTATSEVTPGADIWWGPETKRLRNHSGTPPLQEPGPEGVYNEITQPVTHCGYLYRAITPHKLPSAKKSKEDFQRTWCSLERALLFFETEKCLEPLGHIESGDLISLGVSRAQALTSPGPTERFPFTLELFLTGEKVQQLGTEGPETLQAWASAIGKWFSPVSCHCHLSYEFQRVGQLRYKCMLNPEKWQKAFFILQKAHLFICPTEEEGAEDSINLRRLQELSLVPPTETPEKKELLVLVEMGRTFYLQGLSRADSVAWYSDIQASAGGRGNALRDQQLSRGDIPIIVDSCIAFITQYGLRHEGIYRKNGAKSRIKVLMEEFRRDARNVKLRISDNFIEDVTDVLKRFFRELEDPVFTLELHPQWKEAAEISSKPQRLERYKELIHRLPRLNHRTLAALIGHLYRVQKCADLNQMSTKNLSLLFAPSLFQTDGKGEHEVKVMEDLIDNYVSIFNIDEDQVSQMDLENSLITTWKDTQLSQAGDLIIEVYLEQKLPDCCVTLKVSPTMTAEELTNQVLEMRNVVASLDIWLTFEALENGELERPLHPKEKVLEQALQWCKLPEPSAAYLLVKKVPLGEGSCLFTGAKRETPKCGLLKCREEPPKLLGNKFQERYFVIRDRRLLLLKEKRSVKPEREWSLDAAKVYMGIRKKLKPPAQWGFTLTLDKQQLYLVCSGQAELWDWTTSILKAQHDDLRPVILRRRSSSDLAKQKFGTMPLVPLHGDSTDATMLSANQTLRRLHTRRTLSMFFPMKMHQDSLEEQQEKEVDTDPVYEEDIVARRDVQAGDLFGLGVQKQRADAQPHHQPDAHADPHLAPHPPGAFPEEGVHHGDVTLQADASEEEDGAVHVPVEESHGDAAQVKLTQEVRVHLLEQLSGLQGKQQRDTELLEDIRSYSKQRAAIDREYGQALQRLASQFVKRDWQRGRGEAGDSRSVASVWRGVIEGTAHAGQVRVTASESWRVLATEVTKTTRISKERMLKKGIERLQKAQAELLETMKELDKAKKQFTHLQRSSEVAKDKAADVEARLRKSDRRIFHTKASLQKLSAKFSARLAEHSRQLAGVQNEFGFALVSATAHLEHYQRMELPAAMQALDGDLYERLREHLSTASRTEVETCRATQEWFQGIEEASGRVSREQDLQLFLQEHPAFALPPQQPFQLAGVEKVSLLSPGDDGASLEKEARRWATRLARDRKNKAHCEEVLQHLEARRQQVPEAEVATLERGMEEVKENIRKAEVSRVKAEARLSLLRAAGLDVEAWLGGAVVGVGEEAPTGLDPGEFDDYEDSEEEEEEEEPGPATRTYPYTCRVIFGYQGCQADELAISQGEELEVIEDGDAEEWVKARNKAGQVGYVPEKYLLSLGGEQGSGGAGPPGPATLHRQLSSIMAAELVLEPGAWLVRALYDYEGQSPEELSFPEGAIIRVLPRAPGEVDDGFWTGDFDGRIGVFPSLVVEELTGAQGTAGQELPSPSPPPFSPPGLTPGASLAPSPYPETPLGGCRQEGTGSGQSSPDLAATRLRPLRAPPPPPSRTPEPDPDLHFS